MAAEHADPLTAFNGRTRDDIHYFTWIGDEGDDPHWLPALAAGQGIGFIDFPNPFRPAIAIKESGHFWTAK